MREIILITGGTGFVGGHLLAFLQQVHPQAKLVLTSHRAHQRQDGVEVRVVDLDSAKAVSDLLEQVSPTQIYHLAAIANVGESFRHPNKVVENNFRLTLNLLEALRAQVKPARTLFVSSSDLYAPSLQPLSEQALISPGSPYAASKAIQDALAISYAKSFSLPIVIARPFNHIGPGQKVGFVVADFAQMIVEAERNPQINQLKVGNLTSARDFTDVRDVVAAYHLLMQQGKVGEIYNVGSGKAVEIGKILDQLLALANKSLQKVIDREKLRPVDNPTVQADIGKIKALGWLPKIPLAQTLADVLESSRQAFARAA